MGNSLFTTEPFLTGKPLEVWLDSMGIKDWSINADGLVDVVCDVDLQRKLGELKRLPVRFGNVGGYFDCYNNRLVSLDGGPEKVGGFFACGHNQLVSLEGGPEKVGGYFWCHRNQLISLKGGPKEVGGDFNCESNQLVSLEGSPTKAGMTFDCSNNQLANLDGVTKEVGGKFFCNDNQLTSLEGAPKEVGGNFWCDHNLLVDFKGMEDVSIRGAFVVTDPAIAGQDNVFISLEGLPKELYSKVRGLDVQAVLELEKKRATSLLDAVVEGLISEVELG